MILDDAIVYSDDDRIERMFDALTRQAQDLQILVFSCRQKAFRDLGGRSLAILPLAPVSGSAMKRDGLGLRLSASDLMRFMACPHATRLDLAWLDGTGPEPGGQRRRGPSSTIWRRARGGPSGAPRSRGQAGRQDRDRRCPFDAAVKATRAALREGPDVVFQGALEGGMWGGYSDAAGLPLATVNALGSVHDEERCTAMSSSGAAAARS